MMGLAENTPLRAPERVRRLIEAEVKLKRGWAISKEREFETDELSLAHKRFNSLSTPLWR